MATEDDAAVEGGESDASSTTNQQETGAPQALGVKMGSTRTVVAENRGGNVVTIQDLTCLASYEDAITGEEHVIFGDEAATQYPDRVQYMLRNGLPTDEESTELAKTYLREFIDENDLPANSVAVYAVPSIDNEAGLQRFEAAL
jgi:hypothetical protein